MIFTRQTVSFMNFVLLRITGKAKPREQHSGLNGWSSSLFHGERPGPGQQSESAVPSGPRLLLLVCHGAYSFSRSPRGPRCTWCHVQGSPKTRLKSRKAQGDFWKILHRAYISLDTIKSSGRAKLQGGAPATLGGGRQGCQAAGLPSTWALVTASAGDHAAGVAGVAGGAV